MADINVERKGPSIWPWILGLIVLALLIWALAELLGDDDDDVAEPVATEMVEPAPVVTEPAMVAAGALPVAAILASPATYTGQTLGGEVRVVEVPTDRGFWIEDNGQRMLAVIDEPREDLRNINAGQMLRISEAHVYDASNMAQIPGQIDDDTRRLMQGQPVVLHVPARNIEILNQPGA